MNWTGRLGHDCAIATGDANRAIAAACITHKCLFIVVPPRCSRFYQFQSTDYSVLDLDGLQSKSLL
jgi:hypothetical protein